MNTFMYVDPYISPPPPQFFFFLSITQSVIGNDETTTAKLTGGKKLFQMLSKHCEKKAICVQCQQLCDGRSVFKKNLMEYGKCTVKLG